jgi:hypothetical protein
MRLECSLLGGALALSAAGGWGQTDIPDHDRTPGAVDPAITQDNIAQTACVSGYTKIVRPPSSYTTRLKAEQMLELGLPGTVRDYYEDHLVPLCVGGHPSDPRNLWPEPVAGQWSAGVKDQLEGSVYRAVCSGAMTLLEGQRIFLVPDWTKEYEIFFELK